MANDEDDDDDVDEDYDKKILKNNLYCSWQKDCYRYTEIPFCCNEYSTQELIWMWLEKKTQKKKFPLLATWNYCYK